MTHRESTPGGAAKRPGGRWRLLRVALVVLAATALGSTGPAAAQTAGTLSGETLNADLNFFHSDNVPTGDLVITGSCDASSESTFQFTSSGPATGPYPGTYQETGTFTLSAPSPLRHLVAFEATFSIDSPLGHVTGRKFLSGTASESSSCTENSAFRIVNVDGTPIGYEATVQTQAGTTTERGETSIAMNDQTFSGGSPTIFLFHQFFITSETAPPGPATVTVTPAAAINDIGDQHCVTATVRDAAGNPLPGVSVVFEVSGANPQPAQASTTDQNGEARFCYTGLTPGQDVITAFADSNGNGTRDVGEPQGVATKTYVVPASTAGCSVDMAGWFTADDGDQASFGGNAKATSPATALGQQEYQDHGPARALNFHSTLTLALSCSGQRARVFGHGTVDGTQPVFYRIDLTDSDEPGRSDTYRIRLSNGYDSGEHSLLGGNIQVRP